MNAHGTFHTFSVLAFFRVPKVGGTSVGVLAVLLFFVFGHTRLAPMLIALLGLVRGSFQLVAVR